MAPLALSEALPNTVAALSKRYYYCDDDFLDHDYNCHSAWYTWGRWVFAAIVVVFFIALFAIWGCINSRRRRRNGMRPVYGTGWMAPPKYPGGPNQHYPPPPAYNAPPQQPAYTGTSFNTTNGYYGHHEGIQMSPQPPANTYHRPADGMGGGQEYFAPPAGPPPGK